MKDKEFLEFLGQGEEVPTGLKEAVRQDVILSFQGRSLFLKFLIFQILGGLMSLIICPQFGLSFFVEGHGFIHHLRMIGDWACALYCGSLFLLSGALVSFASMKKEELRWVWSHQQLVLLFLPALFWGILMLLNLSLALPKEDLSYHVTWILAGIGMQFISGKMRIFQRAV